MTKFVSTPKYGIVVKLLSSRTYLGRHFDSTTNYAIAAFDFGRMNVSEDEPKKPVLRVPVHVTGIKQAYEAGQEQSRFLDMWQWILNASEHYGQLYGSVEDYYCTLWLYDMDHPANVRRNNSQW